MKKVRIAAMCICALLFLGAVFSCDDSEVTTLGTLSVKLSLKDGLSDIELKNIPVKIVNTHDNVESTASTDETGTALFENLPAGTYGVSVLKDVEDDNYALTGTLNNVLVKQAETSSVLVEISAINLSGGLVIKEVYTVGSIIGNVYFKDQFVELFNNADTTIYADGLYLAEIYGDVGQGSFKPIKELLPETKDHVYASLVAQVPGSGKEYPIAPGKSFLIALNAINFKEGQTENLDLILDNSGADLEHYSVEWMEKQGRIGNPYFDLNNPSVNNMTNIYIADGLLGCFMFWFTGSSVVIFNNDKGFTNDDVVKIDLTPKTEINLMKIPVKNVIDGVDILLNPKVEEYKRLHSSIDEGFTYYDPENVSMYAGKSARRKLDEAKTKRFGRNILQDTNNSTLDWERIDRPAPRCYDN